MPPDNSPANVRSRAASPPANDEGYRAGTPPSYLSALRELDSVDASVLNLSSTLTTPAEDPDTLPHDIASLRYDLQTAHESNDELDQMLAELRREQPSTDYSRALGRSHFTEREGRLRPASSRLLSSSNHSSQSADSLRSAAILQSVRRHPRFAARARDAHNPSRMPSHGAEARDSDNQYQAAVQRLSERRTSLERERDRDMLSRVESFRRSYLDRSNPPAAQAPTASPLVEAGIKYLSRIRNATVHESLDYASDAGFLSKDFLCEDHADFVLDTFTIPPPPPTSWLAPGAKLSGCQHATSINSTVTASSTTTGASSTLYRFRNNDTMTSTVFDPRTPFDASRPWLSHTYTPPHRRSYHSQSLSPGSHPEIVTTHTPQQDRWPVKVTIHAVDYEDMSLSATMEAYNVPSHPHSHQSLLNASSHSSSLDPSSPYTRTSSITTYLEGEILDFNRHTLLTESFKSSAANDALYWRKLPCFQQYSDEDLVRNLTSRRWLAEVLGREWVLMRWKERCFVKSLPRAGVGTTSFPHMRGDSGAVRGFNRPPDAFGSVPTTRGNGAMSHDGAVREDDQHFTAFDDSGCGLTISGFYYVCLRRWDGQLEGLYYDPQSSPYQCLKLESVNGGVSPAWGFR